MCLLLNQYDNHEGPTADRMRRRDAERNIILFCLFSPECKTVVVKVLSNWYVMHRVGQNICKCTETKTSKNIPCCCYAVALFHFHLSSRVIKETDEKNCTLNHLCKPRLWSRAAVHALLCMRCCVCETASQDGNGEFHRTSKSVFLPACSRTGPQYVRQTTTTNAFSFFCQ